MASASELRASMPQAEGELRTLIDTLPILAWTAKPDGSVDFFSRRWIEYVGLKPEQAVGQGWVIALHPNDVERVVSYWKQLLPKKDTGEIQARLRRFDGVYRWFLFRAVPLLNDRDEVVKWYGTNTDIEDQKDAEEELRRSKAYLENALKLSRTGSVGFRVADQQVFWSAEYDPAVPATMEMVLARVHPEDVVLLQDVFARAAEGAAAFDFEHRLLMPDGSIKHIRNLARSVTDEFGNDEVLGAVTDVTEQHKARCALEEALEKTSRSESILAEGERISLTGSGSWDLVTGKMTWSAQNWRMLGLDPTENEASTELFLQRVHPDDVPRLAPVIEAEMAALRPYSLNYRIVMPDGSIKHFHTLMRPIVKPSGKVEEYIGVSRDVSEAKMAEQALRRSEQVARGQVEALVQSLDTLATEAAPELFTERMLKTIGGLLGAQCVALWLLDDARASLSLRGIIDTRITEPAHHDHPFVKDPTLWKEDASLQELFSGGLPIASEDVATDFRVPQALRKYLVEQGSRRLLYLPTLVGGIAQGFIAIYHGEREPYGMSEIELGQALAHQTMLALQIAQAATLEERNRMARDIHDTLAQGFTAVIIQLQGAADAKERGLDAELDQHLGNALELARSSLNEARRSVQALRPQALEHATLWEALTALIKKTTAGTRLQIGFQHDGDAPHLSATVQEHLLHIGREALTNTLRYAHASRFETRLCSTSHCVRLEFEDNGRGFNPSDPHDGYGLIGMRERAAKIGGSVEIITAHGCGTKIVVVAPESSAIAR
jgi:PAS domain S-box-containing protein